MDGVANFAAIVGLATFVTALQDIVKLVVQMTSGESAVYWVVAFSHIV